MANYGTAQAGSYDPPNQGLNVTALIPGDRYTLWDAITPSGSGVASVAFSAAKSGPVTAPIVFAAHWATAPTASVVNIEGANVDLDADYQILASILTGVLTNGYYADEGGFAFYRAKIASLTIGPGAGLTVIVQR